MKEQISIRKNIYDSGKFREVVDTNFSELFSARESFSVEEFFDLYNELFLTIPIKGELSHEALIRKSRQLITPGKDAKDKEIENLQSLIEDLQKQLLDATQPSAEVEAIKEHPLFPNGTLVSRKTTSPHWPDLFYMDQGYKRAVLFSGGQFAEEVKGLKTLTGYDNKEIPRFPDSVIDGIPSGADLSLQNMNDKWTPSEFLAESESLRIALDPTDANLNLDNYDGDYDRYKSELEKDYAEKTDYIFSLNEKIDDLKLKIQQIKGG